MLLGGGVSLVGRQAAVDCSAGVSGSGGCQGLLSLLALQFLHLVASLLGIVNAWPNDGLCSLPGPGKAAFRVACCICSEIMYAAALGAGADE